MRGFLPDQTRISQVHLRTARLERLLDFYTGVLGLSESPLPGTQAILSPMPNEPGLLVLSEDRNASPRPPRATGLYHFALRYSNRNDLAQAYRRIVNAGYPIAGASDHGVSEAIYLSDPDGNGVELYADRWIGFLPYGGSGRGNPLLPEPSGTTIGLPGADRAEGTGQPNSESP